MNDQDPALLQGYKPETVHAALGPAFYDAVKPARFPRQILRYRNQRWAKRVGLGDLDDAAWQAHFAAFTPLPGSFAEPLALRYHGHQFRVYNPDLGDGRGFLFAQLRDQAGRLLDLGTKGSGQTPYSRAGDGRLTLKGGVREVLATDMLEALGVNTSKSFSLFETGEALQRGDEPSPTRSSVLVRLSHSHIRLGTFQRFAAHNDADHIARLIAHVVEHYMPDCARAEVSDQAVAVLAQTCRNVAAMCAQWMAAGFVHGVLNTDNVVVTGESFDYGPFRFLPAFDPGFTAAYFDHSGLYAFGRQPGALAWNLERFAECLLLVAPIAALEEALNTYQPAFADALRAAVTRRLGVEAAGPAQDDALIQRLFGFLQTSGAPFEQVFFDWYGGARRQPRALAGPAAKHYSGPEFQAFLDTLGSYSPDANALTAPAYFDRDRPVTMMHADVEAVFQPIADRDDWSAFTAKLGEVALVREAYGVAP
jgi:uncharacterized protein YdiU (UPF0061 family)